MASAIVPIIAAAAPLLTPLIKSLVIHAEHLFGAKTGPAKLESVVNAVLPLVGQLATAGKIPGNLDAASVTVIVESIVQALKGQGVLNPSDAAAIVSQPMSTSGTMRITGGSLQFQVG